MNDPRTLGLPFSRWLEGQRPAVGILLASPATYTALVLPTGSGKSAIYLGAAKHSRARAVVLVQTKALQDQLVRDYRHTGLIDVRGASNYPCLASEPDGELWHLTREPVTCERGPCRAGAKCSLKRTEANPEGGCLYYDTVHRAQEAQLIVTNYQCWFYWWAFGAGFGHVDLLVCDEAHTIPGEMASFLQVKLSTAELARDLTDHPASLLPVEWAVWASRNASIIKSIVVSLGRPKTLEDTQRKHQLVELASKLERLSVIDVNDWAVFFEDDGSVTVAPSGHIPVDLLRRTARRVVFVSATLRKKTLELLNLSDDEVVWHESSRAFNPARRPVYHIPTATLNHATEPDNLPVVLDRLGAILRSRRNWKGIVHTGSYLRRDAVLGLRDTGVSFLWHDRTNTQEVIRRFRLATEPVVLVSPAVTTGYDFPAEMCRFNVVLKMPWPDLRDPLIQARQLHDAEYAAYITAQTLVQMTGRGMRAADDWQETFILDDNVSWFINRYADFLPSWWLDAYQTPEEIPPPLEGEGL